MGDSLDSWLNILLIGGVRVFLMLSQTLRSDAYLVYLFSHHAAGNKLTGTRHRLTELEPFQIRYTALPNYKVDYLGTDDSNQPLLNL
jgi:hypothetical protein